MSRRPGKEGKTLAMYQFLTEHADSWARAMNLARDLAAEFNLESRYSRMVVDQWAEHVGARRTTRGKAVFYCVRDIRPDPTVVSADAWRQLPQRFRQSRPLSRIPEDQRDYLILLAKLALQGQEKARAEFNAIAKKHHIQRIMKISSRK